MRVPILVGLLVSLVAGQNASTTAPFTNTTSTVSAPNSIATTAVPYQLQTPPLDTDWTDQVGTDPWPDHPRPQLKREKWQNLNGIWTYQPANGLGAADNPPKGTFANEILIPSCVESAISGIQEQNVTYMWFETSFKVDSDWKGDKVLLHFEAVDYQATVYINGELAGTNTGGYFRFTIDATNFISFKGVNQV